MPMAPFDPITAIYTPAHAWMYETIVAPAVYRSRHVIDEYFLPHLPPNARILDIESRLYVLVYTPREGRAHVISLRKANKREVRRHANQAKNKTSSNGS